MKKIKALIHLTSENSVDHLSPLIWYLIKNNHKVLIYFLKDYQYEEDYRINIFKKYKNFHIMNRQEYFENFFNFFILKILNYLIKVKELYLKKNSVFSKFLVFFIKKTSKLKKFGIDFIFYQWGEFSHHIIPAKILGIDVIGLPHGFNFYLNEDTNYTLKKILKDKKKLSKVFFNHNLYDHYIVENHITKLRSINLGVNKKNIKVWGTPRYSKKWIKFNYKILHKKKSAKRKKILFLLPHWSFRVNVDKTFKLIKKVSQKFPGQVTLKPHIRPKLTKYDMKANKLLDSFESKYGLEVARNIQTPTLISNHKIIIGFGTSVIIDALYLKKKVLIPDYLQKNKTIYSELKLPNVVKSSKDCINKLSKKNLDFRKKNNFRLLEKKYIIHKNKKLDILENYLNQLIDLKVNRANQEQ